MKKKTIIGAFTKTGLSQFNSEAVLRKMAHFDGLSEAPIAMDSVDLPFH
jgi:hypothetical protein